MYQVLIVEDNKDICDIIQFYLKQANIYDMTFVKSGEQALEEIERKAFDIILLDIMLPGMDGIEFCQKVREKMFCPIIFTSCLNDDETISKAIHMGGDDYLVKPFRGPVLLAHMEANLRRGKMSENTCFTFKDLSLDAQVKEVRKDGHIVPLSPTEYDLLAYFMSNKGKFLSFDDIYQAVWQRPSLGDTRSLYVHVYNLRKKIGDDSTNSIYIKTHLRDGYIFGE